MPNGKDKTKYVTPGAMDLMQWKSSGKSADGYVADKRNMEGGKAGVRLKAPRPATPIP
jgi:hypothetical protein